MKTYLGLICAIALLLMPTIGLTADTATVGVSAYVDEQLDLTIWVKKVQGDQDPADGVDSSIMDFGALKDTLDDGSKVGNLFSPTWFAVFMIPTTSGRPYRVEQTANSMTSGASSIPDNCFMMDPDYRSEDKWEWDGGSTEQGAMPGGASLGSPGSAVGTKTIYTSENAGSSHIIRCYYSLTSGVKSDGIGVEGFSGEGIPLDQPSGNYTASVTFSVVLQ